MKSMRRHGVRETWLEEKMPVKLKLQSPAVATNSVLTSCSLDSGAATAPISARIDRMKKSLVRPPRRKSSFTIAHELLELLAVERPTTA